MTSICRLLGFDFGLKRIGVAVGQTITQSARPLCTLKAENGIPRWNEINQLIREWQPDVLVVGLPLNMDGTSQKITDYTREFIKSLEDQLKLPVFTVDERLTTVEARQRVFDEAGFKGLKDSQIDAIAAQLILESFMSDNK